MKYLILDEINSFQCIGSDCPYTCCANWGIGIDADSVNYYRSVDGKFGERLRNSIVTKGELNFFLLHNGRCPFLNNDSLCDIYINLGEENMCTTCKTYPRKNWTYGDLTFIGKNISCPEVARILFEAKSPLQFSFTEDNSIPNEEIDWSLFNLYVSGMTTSIEILQNQELDFSDRMRALLLFNYYFQNHLNSGKDCAELFDLFSSTTSILELMESIHHIATIYHSRFALFITIAQNISLISDNMPITDYLSQGIEFLNEPQEIIPEKLWHYTLQSDNGINLSHIHEQYSVYYLSMYYMSSMSNKQPYNFIIQFFALFYLQNCFEAFIFQKEKKPLILSKIIEIYTRTARVYEHSYKNKNLETTFSILEKNEMVSLPFLFSLI